MSRPCSRATLSIRAAGPTSVGRINPASAASTAPLSDVSSQGCVTTVAAERPYSVANVISLGLVSGLLALSGMMMVDVMLNMWSFSGTNSISTGLMDAFVSMIGM